MDFFMFFDSNLVGNETKSNGNPVIFLANPRKLPWFELVQNPCHVWAWKSNKTWINYMEKPWNSVSVLTKLSSICDMKWHEISVRIYVTFFAVHVILSGFTSDSTKLIYGTEYLLLKMGHGFFHDLLSAVRSKMSSNSIGILSFSWQMPWKWHDLNLSKIHVMFEHANQIQSG